MLFMKKFLQLSLKLQINIFLIAVFIITLIVIFLFSESISGMHFYFVRNKNMDYFTSMERSIFESETQFINICLLQYENIIKFFNSEIYHYNSNRTMLNYFKDRMHIPHNITQQRVHVFKNISELNNYPDYNESISDDEKKLFIYCESNDTDICNGISELIEINSLSNLNQNKAIRNFKIPYYGDKPLLDEYMYVLKQHHIIYSVNNTKMKEIVNQNKGIDNLIATLSKFIKNDYNFYTQIFEEYSDEKMELLNVMYNKTYYIFEEYKSISDKEEKEHYMKNHSIYFQIFDYENDFTYFFDSWDEKEINTIGGNVIIPNYLSEILFNISKKIDMVTLPINNSTKKLMSKNACYFLIIKQLFYLWTKTDYSYDKEMLKKIFNKIYNNGDITDINVCKINTYYEDMSEEINFYDEVSNYYDLENTIDTYLYNLNKEDLMSYIFQMKSTYPNLESLQLFYPNFFSFHQLNFYSFKAGSNLSRLVSLSDSYVSNINYFIFIMLWFFWLIITIIFIILLSIIIPKITKPIERLTQIINLNANDLKNQKIFEYDLDDDINNFFSLCKNLIEGEMINNDLELNEILEDKTLDDSCNNNMIINNKMILELIESQKCLSNNDKNIFLLKDGNINDKKKRGQKSPKVKNKKTNRNINHSDVIKLISINSGETSERNSIFSNKFKENNDIKESKEIKENKENKENKEEINSQVNEDDSESNNLKLYEDLIKISNYVFYGDEKEKEKSNKIKKNLDKSSTISKKSKQDNSIKIIKGINNIAYYWYTSEKENKNIRRYTNIYA